MNARHFLLCTFRLDGFGDLAILAGAFSENPQDRFPCSIISKRVAGTPLAVDDIFLTLVVSVV